MRSLELGRKTRVNPRSPPIWFRKQDVQANRITRSKKASSAKTARSVIKEILLITDSSYAFIGDQRVDGILSDNCALAHISVVSQLLPITIVLGS